MLMDENKVILVIDLEFIALKKTAAETYITPPIIRKGLPPRVT